MHPIYIRYHFGKISLFEKYAMKDPLKNINHVQTFYCITMKNSTIQSGTLQFLTLNF